MKKDEFYVELGNRIRLARGRLGMTQQDLANHIGVSRPSITNIESARQHVSMWRLAQIAAACRIELHDLVDPDFVMVDREEMEMSMASIALSMYVGEPCRICGRKMSMKKLKNGAKYVGYSEKYGGARVAHGRCWEGMMDVLDDMMSEDSI